MHSSTIKVQFRAIIVCTNTVSAIGGNMMERRKRAELKLVKGLTKHSIKYRHYSIEYDVVSKVMVHRLMSKYILWIWICIRYKKNIASNLMHKIKLTEHRLHTAETINIWENCQRKQPILQTVNLKGLEEKQIKRVKKIWRAFICCGVLRTQIDHPVLKFLTTKIHANAKAEKKL